MITNPHSRVRPPFHSPVTILLAACLFLFRPICCHGGIDLVKAELGKTSAWTGEAVPFFVILYSPGPFSGTPTFELPELPMCFFMPVGNPVVGSEVVADETYFVQRHEFAFYTQQVGEVVIPAFRVHFAGKKSFTSPVESMVGSTPELHFQSAHPPATEHLGIVVAVRNMEVTQNWRPHQIGTAQAGDVFARTIDRNATGTTAMMFPSVRLESLIGVRCYATEPIVVDSTERGQSLARRSDTIKYQFESAGTIQLPDVSVSWWDLDSRELKYVVLPGETVDVRSDVPIAEPPAVTRESDWPRVALALAVGIVMCLVLKSVMSLWAVRESKRNDFANVAAERLIAACRSDSAANAYSAMLQWKRAVNYDEAVAERRLPPGAATEFEQEWGVLEQLLFAAGPSNVSWSGQRLCDLFRSMRRAAKKSDRDERANIGLPALNPSNRG